MHRLFAGLALLMLLAFALAGCGSTPPANPPPGAPPAPVPPSASPAPTAPRVSAFRPAKPSGKYLIPPGPEGKEPIVAFIAWNADSQGFITGSEDTLARWKLKGTSPESVVPRESVHRALVARSTDGKWLAMTAPYRPEIELVDAGSLAGSRKITAKAEAKNLVFSPDSARLAACLADKSIQLIDVVGSGPPLELARVDDYQTPLAFLGPTRLAFSDKGKIAIWDLEKKAQEKVIDAKLEGVRLAASADGGKVLGVAKVDYKEHVCCWDVATGNRLWATRSSLPAQNFALSRDGKYAAYWDYFGFVVLLKMEDGAEVARLQGVCDAERMGVPRPLEFSPDSQWLALGNRYLKVWRVEQMAGDAASFREAGDELKTLQVALGTMHVAISPDGQLLATGGPSGKVTLWNLPALTEHGSFEVPSEEVRGLDFLPDSKRLAVLTGLQRFAFWNRELGKVEDFMPPAEWKSYEAFLVRDHRHAVVTSDDKSILYDLVDQSSVPLPVKIGQFSEFGISPDKAWLAIGGKESFNAVDVWDIKKGQVSRSFKAGNETYEIRFTADLKRLAAATLSGPEILDFASLGPAPGWQNPEGLKICYSVRFSPKEEILAAQTGGSLALLDVKSGALLDVLVGHTGPPKSIAFTPDGTLLVTGGTDGTVKVWKIDKQ